MLRAARGLKLGQGIASLSSREWGASGDYQVLAPLGKGSSARVFMGFNVVTGQRVVIKIFKQLDHDTIKRQIGVNIELLSGLNEKPKLAEFIHLLDVCFDKPSNAFTLIYQFHHGVPLNQLIATMPRLQALRHTFVLAHTLLYVHSRGFIHRDLKPANVLITKDGPKLFDFGLAKRISDTLKTNNFGTKGYKTPEVVYRIPSYSTSVDVWGLGLLLAELALQKRHLLPYESDQQMLSQVASLCQLSKEDASLVPQQLRSHIRVDPRKGWRRLAGEKQLQGSLVQLVERMLQVNPMNRPSLQQVVRHAVFDEVR